VTYVQLCGVEQVPIKRSGVTNVKRIWLYQWRAAVQWKCAQHPAFEQTTSPFDRPVCWWNPTSV